MSARPRLLFLVDSLQDVLGGGERTALRLAVELPHEGFDVWMCTTRQASGWPLEQLAEAGVHHVAASRRSRTDLAGLKPLWRTLRDERIDILHAHLYGSNVWGTLLGRAAGVPVVVAHEHSWPYEGDPIRVVVDTAIGHIADAFVAVSRADAGLMTTVERVPPGKIHVIPSAWTDRSNGTAPIDLRAELDIPAGAPVVGTVAVLRRVKRLELLVQAFRHVLERVPDAYLLIAGDGPDRPVVEAAIAECGVAERVRMAGSREDIEAVWRALDVGAMSSDREGVPVAALEALAHGIPMVAPAVGGLPEIFADGGGVLVPRHDVEALGREIADLLANPERRRAMGAAGLARAPEYSAERQVERCVTLYRELLASPKARRRAARRA
jgi:glycosyltransferase involved in cell wall biosynthesis